MKLQRILTLSLILLSFLSYVGEFLYFNFGASAILWSNILRICCNLILKKEYRVKKLNWNNRSGVYLCWSIGYFLSEMYFLQLLDSCLKSPLLPAYLAAAFAKKLSRLSLSVPPSGALVIIALIHNLLRRHPSINCLVHRVAITVLPSWFFFSIMCPLSVWSWCKWGVLGLLWVVDMIL